MAKDKSSKISKKGKVGKVSSKKDKKAARLAEKAAKKASKKGDGSFPDVLIVTASDDPTAGTWFQGHDGESMSGLVQDGQTVAVYKLRKVSKISIKRKIER